MSDKSSSTTSGPNTTTQAASGPTMASAPVRGQSIDDALWAEIVNEWANTALRNSAIAQATEAYNHLIGVGLPALRKILESRL